jgi:hypothetical protein
MRLNHYFCSLEQAFDSLLDAGFYLAGCCGTGTSNSVQGKKLFLKDKY